MAPRKKKVSQKAAKYVWSEKAEDDLIDLYEEHEFLYNHTLADFKDAEKKTAAYEYFDKKLGVPVGASKQHIDSIRTRYGRDKKEYLCPPSGSARKKPPPNEKIFMCRLKFLFKHITPRPSRNSLTNRKLIVKFKWPQRPYARKILQVNADDGGGDAGQGFSQGTVECDGSCDVRNYNDSEGNGNCIDESTSKEAYPDGKEDGRGDVQDELINDQKWDGADASPVDNIPESEAIEEDPETVEAAKILADIEKSGVGVGEEMAQDVGMTNEINLTGVGETEKQVDVNIPGGNEEDIGGGTTDGDEITLSTQKTIVIEIADTDLPSESKDISADVSNETSDKTSTQKNSDTKPDEIEVSKKPALGLQKHVEINESWSDDDYIPDELKEEIRKKRTNGGDATASCSGVGPPNKVSKKNIFNTDDYLPSDYVSGSPRSPTPPPPPTKKTFQPPLKKGIGKSTVRQASNPRAKNPCPAHASGPTQADTGAPMTAVEKERLKVLKSLNDSLAKEAKDSKEDKKKMEEFDEDRHWTNTLYFKSKRVENETLKEQTVAVVNNIFSYSILNERHPAIEAMFPTLNHRNFQYNMPVHSAVPQISQIYYTPPPYQNPNHANSSLRFQQPVINIQQQQQQQQQQATLTPAPTPTIAQVAHQSTVSNVGSIPSATYSYSAASRSYIPPTPEYPFGLTNSPMKPQNLISQNINAFVPSPQLSSQTMEFTQL